MPIAFALLLAATAAELPPEWHDDEPLSVLPNQDRSKLRDVSKYRTPARHPRLKSVPLKLTARMKTDPVRATPELVGVLTRGISDPFEKLRVLHDWVATTLRYDWESFRSGALPPQDAAAVLKSGVSVCEGYANVMSTLCRYAKLECVKIGGFARGVRTTPLESRSESNHAWNAAKLDGAWYLVDATWDSRPFGTSYFLADPVHFVHQHFPDQPAWQLLEPPRTGDAFDRSPWATAGYLALTGAAPVGVDFVTDLGSSVSFWQPHPPGVVFQAQLRPLGADAGTLADRWVAMRPADGGTAMEFAAPSAGEWQLDVLARRGAAYDALTLFLRADAGAEHGWASFSSELAELTGPMVMDERVPGEVHLDVPHGRDVSLIVAMEEPADRRWKSPWTQLTPVDGGSRLSIRFPDAGGHTLEIWANAGKREAYSRLEFDAQSGAASGFLVLPQKVLELAGPPREGVPLGNRFGKNLKLTFDRRKDIELRAQLNPLERGGRGHPVFAVVGRETIELIASFPKPGPWLFAIWARRRGGAWQTEFSSLIYSEDR